MKSSCLIFLFFLLSHWVSAQPYLEQPLRDGDLLFQDLDCGPLCEAIEKVTPGYEGRHFSHIGMVTISGDSVWVIEALGAAVTRTLLPVFLSRSNHEVLIGRLQDSLLKLVPQAIGYAEKQLGVPYDDAFLYGNGKYYCSELIYDAFMFANGGQRVFVLEPMTFKQPGTDAFFPAWESYYSQLRMDIPEGQPGINPGGISRSPLLRIYKLRQ